MGSFAGVLPWLFVRLRRRSTGSPEKLGSDPIFLSGPCSLSSSLTVSEASSLYSVPCLRLGAAG